MSAVPKNKSAQRKGATLNIGSISVPMMGTVKNINGSISLKSNVPSTFGSMDRITGPIKSMDSNGNLRIKNREYIGDILSTNADFHIHHVFLLNPTIDSSFPWLSSVAGSFQKFCFESLCFEFQTQSGTNTFGNVMIIPQYDVASNLPVEKSEALALVDSIRGPAWQSMCGVLPRQRLCGLSSYFTEIDLDDIKMSIPGKVSIATSNCTDAGPLTGEIWVSYDVKLTSPQSSNNEPFCIYKTEITNQTNPLPPSWVDSGTGILASEQSVYLHGLAGSSSVVAPTLRLTFNRPGKYRLLRSLSADMPDSTTYPSFLFNKSTRTGHHYTYDRYSSPTFGADTTLLEFEVGMDPVCLDTMVLNSVTEIEDWSNVTYWYTAYQISSFQSLPFSATGNVV